MRKSKKEMREHVMAFPTDLLHRIGYFQGIEFDHDRYVQSIIRERNYSYIRRSEAEGDTRHKQLIPYVIFACGGQILRYQRGALLSEDLLQGKHSIGIGGHISAEDENLFQTSYEEGMEREVREEVKVGGEYKDHIVGVINDDTDEVGRVHFGIVHVWVLKEPTIKKREASIKKPHFASINELHNQIAKYENWSQMCIRNMKEIITQVNKHNGPRDRFAELID